MKNDDSKKLKTLIAALTYATAFVGLKAKPNLFPSLEITSNHVASNDTQ